jgi:hypothetical protein
MAAPALDHPTAVADATVAEAIDPPELVRMLREQDRLIQELEAECRELADRLAAFQAEILKWVELDR